MKRGPKKDRENEYTEVRQLKASGMSNLAISRQTGVPPNTVTRWCPEWIKPRQHPYEPDKLCEDAPGNQLPEIELLEKTLAKMVADNAPGPIIASVAAIIGKLRRDWEAGQIRSGQLLSREAMQSLGQAMVTLFVEHFRDVPGFEERMDRVVQALSPLIEGGRNTQRQVNNLIG